MKRTLAISLWLALGAAAVAQNPAVVQKNVQVAGKIASQSSAAKPAPGSVKVVPVPKPGTTTKPVVVSAKPAGQSKPTVIAVRPVQAKSGRARLVSVASKPVAVPPAKVAVAVPATHAAVKGKAAPVAIKASVPKVVAVAKPNSRPVKQQLVEMKAAPPAKDAAADKTHDKTPEAAQAKPVAQNGRRDPFVSPIVSMSSMGSGCSSGKRCLAIDQINLRGIVKADTGMIAVVVNSAEKAYFLRENDPVFNGYVVKITGDSIVFKETFRDKLGKTLTRDVTKSIGRPVA